MFAVVAVVLKTKCQYELDLHTIYPFMWVKIVRIHRFFFHRHTMLGIIIIVYGGGLEDVY